MKFDKYQEIAKGTAIYPSKHKLSYPVMGLCGEAGEVANKYKKLMRQDVSDVSESEKEDLQKELGDVLWYCAAIATDLGVKLSDVAEMNIKKLADRQVKGTIEGNGDNR